MNNKSIKTHFDLNVFITFLVLLLCGLALFSFRLNSEVDCSRVDFDVISNSYTIEDLIEFKGTDTSGVEWTWDFGDGTPEAYRSNVVHQYEKAGTYKVALQMNGECVATREVVISKSKIIRSPELIPNIILPKYVRVGDAVEFFNDSKFARSWQWSFGETTTVDGNDRKETYTYKTPGKKTVLLVVNEDRRHEAKRILTVLPPAKKAKKARNRDITTPIADVLVEIPDAPIEDAPPVVLAEDDSPPYVEVSSEQIQEMLNKYSKRNLDDVAIRKYFAVSNIPVFNAKGDRFTVSEFFKTIRDVNKLDIKSIKLFRSKETGLIKSMTVNMRYKNSLFWKTF